MYLLDKIEPHLTSDDIVVRQFALEAVSKYPETKPEWPVRMMKRIVEDPEETVNYSSAIKNMTLTDEMVPLLKESITVENRLNLHILKQIADELPLEVKLEKREELLHVFSVEEWGFFTEVYEASEEKLELMLENHLLELESGEYFNQQLFIRAKTIADRQAEQGWVDVKELKGIIEEQNEEPSVDYLGMITIYKIGLLKEESLIEEIAPMLLRDEDVLLEVLSDALTSFQSDRVVKAVEPLATGQFPIFQLDIIGETHTPAAVPALKRLYQKIDAIDLKSVIIKGLAERLSAEGLPEIEDFMTYDQYGGVFNMEEMAYGYFKVMGYDHPGLEKWGEKALKQIENYYKPTDEILDMLTKNTSSNTPVKSKKVGRNEPCPCGSGKKYKKCHGK